LSFKLSYAVTDCRYRAAHPARRRPEAPFLCNRKEDTKLVETGISYFHRSNFLNILPRFIAVIGTPDKLYLVNQQRSSSKGTSS
tara:strand:- start:1213 stop:1464 length:252 start_codon:yes stop_codon:yes gene_type:complete